MKNGNDWTISYKQIGVIVFAFSLGVILSLLFANAQTGSPSTFTTTELIGFVLSVILSGSSIVLAIAAISLGKMSEQSVINRSDQSIKLQNEVFIKTTEALQRIEASTGVTEKRLEDIIQGRAGDISHQVAETAFRHRWQGPRDVKELEKTIRKSLLSSIREGSDSDRKKQEDLKITEDEKIEEIYQESHNKLLLDVGNLDNVKISKIGHGTIRADGTDDGNIFDGLFEIGDKKFSVSTFRSDIKADLLKTFLPAFAKELAESDLEKSFMVLFCSKGSPARDDILSKELDIMKESIANRIEFLSTPYDKLDRVVNQIREKI